MWQNQKGMTINIEDNRSMHATRDQVYRALNDDRILSQCIPGCRDLTKTSDTQMIADAQLKIGPIKANFKFDVTLYDLNPPFSYSIRGQGKGGAAGFAKGEAKINLIDNGASTTIIYVVHAEVGGKLAQIGSRLVDQAARHLSNEFFTKFSVLVEHQQVQT